MEKDILTFPFELKESDDATGVFTGYASTFGGKKDSKGDIVEKGAFAETVKNGGRNGNGIAMLWQHDSDKIPGVWKELEEDEKGLRAVGQLAMKTQLGNDAYELIKLGGIKGLSIGFSTKEHTIDEDKQIRYLKKVDLWEVSLVTFPANTRANIIGIKSLEDARTPRQLEDALREVGLSSEAAKYIVKLAKPSLREVEKGEEFSMSKVLAEVSKINIELDIKRQLQNCYI